MSQNDSRFKVVTGVVVLVALIVVVVVVVVVTGDSSATEPPATEPPGNVCSITPNEEVRNGDDYIGLVFTSCPSDGALEAFESAANRWSAIIDGTTRPSLNVEEDITPAQVCGFSGTVPIFQVNQDIDHLVIMVETLEIDGPGGALAGALPCGFTEDFKVGLGGMIFDTADLDVMEADGSLEDVVTHEMGHVLGIGSLWGDLLEDRTFTTISSSQIAVNPDAVPKFVGDSATAEYGVLTGSDEASVPVEDFRDADGIRFADVLEGLGSIDAHWKITDFFNELMVFSIDPSLPHPLSRMSLASLEDLGYTVDLSLADEYQLPGAKKHKTNVRGAAQAHVLHGDVLKVFKSKEDVRSRIYKSPKR